MIARRTATPRVGVTLAWTALDGTKVRGSVWSAGPHPGTVWALPAGSPTAVLVLTRAGAFKEIGRV